MLKSYANNGSSGYMRRSSGYNSSAAVMPILYIGFVRAVERARRFPIVALFVHRNSLTMSDHRGKETSRRKAATSVF